MLFFTRKKGKASEKKSEEEPGILSERDIQERLYGGYRNTQKSVSGSRKQSSLVSRAKDEKRVDAPAELFPEPNVSELESSLISKAVMQEPVARKPSVPEKSKPREHDHVPLVATEDSHSADIWKSAKKKKKRLVTSEDEESPRPAAQKPASKPLPKLVAADYLAGRDTLNFRLEWEEWKGRLRNISVWHIVTAISVAVGVLVLFNVLIDFTVSQNRSVIDENISAKRDIRERSEADVRIVPVSGLMENAETRREDMSLSAVPVSEAVEVPKEVVPLKSLPMERASAAAPPVTVETSNRIARPYYAIQICIYEREKMVERLIDQLKEDGYSNLSYEKTVTSSGRILYRVYKGQYQEFREAQEGMVAFRKDPLFKRFPDSFIRTVK